MSDTILQVNDVTQAMDLNLVKDKIKRMASEPIMETLDDGRIKVTFILDPKKEKKDE